jgi:hypothetical protein
MFVKNLRYFRQCESSSRILGVSDREFQRQQTVKNLAPELLHILSTLILLADSPCKGRQFAAGARLS